MPAMFALPLAAVLRRAGLRDILASAAPLTAHEKVAMARRFQADLEMPDDFDVGLAIRVGRDDEEEYRTAQGHAPGRKASQG